MVRWIINGVFSLLCLILIYGTLRNIHGLALVVMLPYLFFELLQIVFLMTNRTPIDGARSVVEVVIPVLGAAWPMIAGQMMHLRLIGGHQKLVNIGLAVLVLIYVIELITLLQIRYNFSILPEARSVVSKGIYRYVRHPLYSLYFLWAAIVVLLTLNLNYFLFGLLPMVIILTVRARMEERKLEICLDGYSVYRSKTGMFFPKLDHQRRH